MDACQLRRSFMMRSKSRFVAVVILVSISIVLLFGANNSVSRRLPRIDTFIRTTLSARSAYLESNLANPGSPFQTPVDEYNKEDETYYYQQELERLKSSPYIYREKTAQEISLMSRPTVKTIFWFPGGYSNTFEECPYKNCKIGKDMISSDYVVFHAALMIRITRKSRKNVVVPEYVRPNKQMWVTFTTDPPWVIQIFARWYPELLASFNMTASYRQDVDIPFVFGRLKPRSEPLYKDYDALFDQKIGMAAWVTSHCQTLSRREEYVERMSKVPGFDVHIYGACGNQSRHDCLVKQDWTHPDKCLPGLGQQFKFYFSFENHFCPDYVSEKFFKIFYKNMIDMIPVVRGSFDFKRFIPRDIFIDAADFKTPEDLARYLIKVGNNKKVYTEMLRKKDRWVFADSDTVPCKVCEMAHTHPDHTGYHENFLHSFYGGPEDTCTKPTDLDS